MGTTGEAEGSPIAEAVEVVEGLGRTGVLAAAGKTCGVEAQPALAGRGNRRTGEGAFNAGGK